MSHLPARTWGNVDDVVLDRRFCRAPSKKSPPDHFKGSGLAAACPAAASSRELERASVGADRRRLARCGQLLRRVTPKQGGVDGFLKSVGVTSASCYFARLLAVNFTDATWTYVVRRLRRQHATHRPKSADEKQELVVGSGTIFVLETLSYVQYVGRP